MKKLIDKGRNKLIDNGMKKLLIYWNEKKMKNFIKSLLQWKKQWNVYRHWNKHAVKKIVQQEHCTKAMT